MAPANSAPLHAPAAPLAPRWPILTQQARVPWTWVALIQLPWFGLNVLDQLSRTAFTFTLQPYVSAPWIITLCTSFDSLFNLLVGAPCNYASDRVWTRWGRRRPFLIIGHLAAGALLIALPLAREFAVLLAVLVLYELVRDVASPTESLEKEVVPVPQRGRGQAITNFARTGGVLFFSAVLLARFDAHYELPGGVTLTGEQIMYWSGAAISFAMAAFYLFCVRETRPATVTAAVPSAVGNRLHTTHFVQAVFGSRQNWALYALGIAMAVFWSGLGNLAPLLVTEQFGYPKSTLAWLNASGQIFTLVAVLPLGGWLADRCDRARLLQGAAMAMLAHHVTFYVYARHFAPHGVPPIGVLVAFSMANVAIGNVGVVAAVSLLFDYVAAGQMGTISAGIGITRTLFDLLARNLIGVWVTVYSSHFAVGGRTDYLSGYHYLIAFAIAATAVVFWFTRLARRGQLVPHGRIEQAERMKHEGAVRSP